MNIDLHVHTRARSPCACSSADAMVRAAIDRGLDGLVITDHDCLVPPQQLAYLNAEYNPFRVFGGIEVTTRGEHVLVLGVEDEELENRWWTYPELHAFVQTRRGFLALAHPFRFDPRRLQVDVEHFPPHALELHSLNTPRRAENRIRQLAAELNVPLLSNSDAHHVSGVGDYYNYLDCEPEGMDALVGMLKEGAFEPVAP
ncbi:MAG: PHP-associated domain-containing protein [Chloroflexota bacterium]|nr:PHP-associated domain-containing protein [Chloroflexota bacterium]